MSNTTVKYIVDLVRTDTLDEDDDGLTDSQMVDRFNLTTRNILTLVPKANSELRSVLLDSGVQQSLPSDALKLLDIECNMGTTPGTTRGAPVEEVEQKVIKRVASAYYSVTASSTIDHFMRIDENDLKFNVYPASDGTGYVLGNFSILPTDVVFDVAGLWESQVIPFDEKYVTPYTVGIKELAYTVDTDMPGNMQRQQLNQSKLLASLQAIGVA